MKWMGPFIRLILLLYGSMRLKYCFKLTGWACEDLHRDKRERERQLLCELETGSVIDVMFINFLVNTPSLSLSSDANTSMLL